jgi:hypothetical protein
VVKIILGIVVGLVVAVAAVMGGEFLLHIIHGGPTPDMNDAAAMQAMMAATPLSMKLAIVAIYFLAALLGGLAAARVSGRPWTAWVIAVVLLAATIANYLMLPHPVWMVAASVGVIALAGWLASRPAGIRRRRAG